MDTLINLAKRRGFIFAGSEIYGGLANSWDYGPLGVELKNNIKKAWWKKFVTSRLDMVGIDSALIMNPKVWEASGHVATFTDPLVECKNCHERFRADQIDVNAACQKCGEKNTFTDPAAFNLMLKTFLGPKEDVAAKAYLRPETAQAMFVDFPQVLASSRKRIPFGIAQIGRAFRNEITPGNFIFRLREFDIMEFEYFVHPNEWEKHFDYWLMEMHDWITECGIDMEKSHDLEVSQEDRAHYSSRTVDIEFDYPFGKKELYGLAYRSDFDLKNHSEYSGKDLSYTDPVSSEKYVPHVIEPTFGLDRTLLAVLISSYDEETDENGETRVVLHLKPHLAPVKAAILPLMKKEEIVAVAKPLAELLAKEFPVEYDETQSIGKRYRRQDEIGTPFCITVDYDSLEDNTVTVRDRDTMKQERVAITDLKDYLNEKIGV
ncbi:MAG TPA: glycine--tRNA ligase [Candidatus Andersenbacteria bacterium]|nr:glycine--tRNA ligase [Candidatus Andersenbacteria bacterium]